MGHVNSHLYNENEKNKKPKLRRKVFIRKLKNLAKHGVRKKKRKLGSRTNSLQNPKSTISIIPREATKNVILPTLERGCDRKWSGLFSKHSLLSYALSKLTVFAKLSRDKISLMVVNGRSSNKKLTPVAKFSFHDHRPKPIVSDSSDKTGSFDVNASSAANIKSDKSIPSSTSKEGTELPAIRSDEIVVVDVNNNKSIRDAVVKRLLSSTSTLKSAKTPDELYRKNLERFETLLAITATTTSEEDSDSVDENNNIIIPKRSRIISTSKNRVEVDAYFLDWMKEKFGCAAKKESSGSDESSDSEVKGKSGKSSKASSKNASKKASKKTISKSSVKKKGSSDSSEEASESEDYRSMGCNKNNICIKKGPCAGKGFVSGSGAPPAYLDYGCSQTYPGAACKKARDPVIERLKNVDVIEQLTYMVPNDPCCQDEGSEEDDCDYYAVCESCGEMEPLPEEIQSQLKRKKNCCKPKETTPVTYSRRQRFNFKNRDDDDDGPPFKWDGNLGKSCRCPCCVAGLRRNPNCGCKCCQTMGNSRRVNSFDEIPVGKNPQIRRILCPMEAQEKKMEQVDSILPEQSGVYKFDVCETEFERQVPRTPSPIILEVPARKRLGRDEVLDIAKGLTQAQTYEDNSCNIDDPYVEVCQPEPIYLPPIYGQFNPCCPPCCNADAINNNEPAKSSGKGTSGKYGTNTYYGSEYNSSGYNESENISEIVTGSGDSESKDSSGSLPQNDDDQ